LFGQAKGRKIPQIEKVVYNELKARVGGRQSGGDLAVAPVRKPIVEDRTCGRSCPKERKVHDITRRRVLPFLVRRGEESGQRESYGKGGNPAYKKINRPGKAFLPSEHFLR